LKVTYLSGRTGGKLMQRAIAIAAFLAAAVACLEAFTLVLITGVTTHWRSSIIGAESKQEA
jgi:uncharacterized membrane protein